MWRIHHGDRVFTNDEWELFADGLDMLRSFVESDIVSCGNYTETGIGVFDALTAEQKLAILADVALALRDPTIATPQHTAANEGAIAAVFETIRDMLDSELDYSKNGQGKSSNIRQRIRAAVGEDPDRSKKLPSATRKKRDIWINLLEEIENRVLWDEDFMLGDQVLDLPPKAAKAVLASLTIHADYYLSVPRDPDERGLTAARQMLARLLGLAVPDDNGLYPALDDQFHSLMIGPCSPEQIDAFIDHPWVEVVHLAEPRWDCDYATWIADFRNAVPAEPFSLNDSSCEVPFGAKLPTDVRVERDGKKWVVWAEQLGYWCGLVENCWTDAPDEETPVLSFATEDEAHSAYLRANQMYAERAERHSVAASRLGLEED